MNLHIFQSLSFVEAMMLSCGVAFTLTMIFAVLLIRKNRSKRRELKRRTRIYNRVWQSNSYQSEAGRKHLDGLCYSLSNKVEELEKLVSGCMEILSQVSAHANLGMDAMEEVESGDTEKPEVISEIRELRNIGVDESEMSSRLNVSGEMMEIYLHKERVGDEEKVSTC
jgi:hypothetical protein